ncbi:MAG: redoxin domain-containing protein [Gemmatimonadota bacterium]
MLELSGAYHERRSAELRVQPGYRLHVEARLARTRYRAAIDSVRVIGDFNGFRTDSSARTLRRQSDGVWVADIPSSTDSVVYALVGVTPRGATPGRSADHLLHVAGSYRSVARTRGGMARISFDPARLVRDTTAGQLAYVGGAEARAARILDSITAHMQRHSAAGQRQQVVTPADWAPTVTRALRDLSVERSPLVRESLLLELLSLVQFGGRIPQRIGVLALQELTPASLAWQSSPSLTYGLPFVAFRVADGVEDLVTPAKASPLFAMDSTRLKRYATRFAARLDSMLAAASSDPMQAQLLQFGVAVTHGVVPERAAEYLGRMQSEFGDRYGTTFALQVWGSEQKLRAKAPMPAFAVRALGDTVQRITNAQLNGKTVLIDFWATTCVPCLGEMAPLQEACEEFKGRGLEILSISADDSPAVVAAFRRARWPMPWQHGWVPGSLTDPVFKSLDIWGIPRAVLVGPDGVILAADRDLRGGALRRTLERVLK